MPHLVFFHGEWFRRFAYVPVKTSDGWVWMQDFEKRFVSYTSPERPSLIGRLTERRSSG